MKVIILYRPESEAARSVETWVHDYQGRHDGTPIQLLNVDSPEGDSLAKLYDITRYPAILATRDDGTLLQLWQDEELPLLDEVAGYTYA